MFWLEFIKRFLGAILFLGMGLHFIINNKVVSLKLLMTPNIFKARISEKKEINLKKLIYGRIFVCIVGGLFIFGGLLLLIYSFRIN